MKPYSSSTLSLFINHCPAALGFHEAGALRCVEWSPGAGIAAHAVLQAVGEEARHRGASPKFDRIEQIARTTCTTLITDGRTFRGAIEPPMSPDDVFAGRDIALDWLADNPVSPKARCETELWLESGEYSAIFDVHELLEDGDEENAAIVAESWDYKSSWPACEADLDSLQCRGHAVLLRENYPSADVVRVGIINLRTRQRFSRDYYPADEFDRDRLNRWRKDIISTVHAANDTRETRPGVGCVGCPYAYRCDDAWDAIRFAPEEPVNRYVIADALRASTAPLVRKTCRDVGPINAKGGVVGFFEKPGRRVAPGASKILAHRVFDVTDDAASEWDAAHARLLGLLQAMRPGLTQVDNAAKWLYPGKENKPARDDLTAALTSQVIESRFEVRKEEMPA